jgi:hypothetical protein
MSNGEKEILMEKNIKLELKKPELSKRRFIAYFGNIGEMIAEEILMKDGYSIWDINSYSCPELSSESKIPKNLLYYLNYLNSMKHQKDRLRAEYEALYSNFDPNIRSIPSWNDYYRNFVTVYLNISKDLKIFFGEKLEDVKAYFKNLGILGEIGIAEDVQEIKSSKRTYTPDLVAKKNGEIYVIEVKANSGDSYLKGEKLNGLLSARKFGLVPILIKLNVTLDANNFIMKEL